MFLPPPFGGFRAAYRVAAISLRRMIRRAQRPVNFQERQGVSPSEGLPDRGCSREPMRAIL